MSTGWSRQLLALGLVLSLLFYGAAANPARSVAAEPLPACQFDDLVTLHGLRSEWRTTLLDTIYRLPPGYAPRRLVSTSAAGLNGGARVRRTMLADLTALAADARAAGAPLRVVSAYRTYSQQQSLYNREVALYGETLARTTVARPGHSEHQLGTTIDFGSADTAKKGWHYNDWADTPAGAWLNANGWRYGFMLSYPKGKKSVTCYRYEPWHWRYLGRELAAAVHDSGLTVREYLWNNFH